jgi:hypothetical protein
MSEPAQLHPEHNVLSRKSDDCAKASYLDELDAALQITIAILTDVDRAYRRRRVAIDHSAMSQVGRMRLLDEVDDLQRRDREPWILTLADLYAEISRMTFPRMLH